MSKSEIIKELKKRSPKLSQPDLETVLDIFSKTVENALKDKRRVELRGFGTLFVKKLKEKYSARNPKTGEIIYVPEKNKVRFKPSKKLLNLINKWKSKRFLLPVIPIILKR